MRILLMWIGRAIKEQNLRVDAERKESKALLTSERWKHQYLQLAEHNKWLQANIDSLHDRIEYLEKELDNA